MIFAAAIIDKDITEFTIQNQLQPPQFIPILISGGVEGCLTLKHDKTRII